jgi:hypothetical protein
MLALYKSRSQASIRERRARRSSALSRTDNDRLVLIRPAHRDGP